MNVRTERLVWAASALALAAAFGVTKLLRVEADIPPAFSAGGAQIAARDSGLARREVARIVASDPFRLDRSPSPLPFAPGGAIVAQIGVPAPQSLQRPALLLRAVVGGPPWEALVEGLPGRSGAVVVRPGDKVGELTVRAIRADSVIIQGMDSTWRLGIARAWH